MENILGSNKHFLMIQNRFKVVEQQCMRHYLQEITSVLIANFQMNDQISLIYFNLIE